jgi:integrase
VSATGANKRKSKNRITKRFTAAGEARYDVRTRINTKAVTRTFKRRADADAWLRQTLVDDLTGVAIEPRKGLITFTDFSSEWLKIGEETCRLRPKTVFGYEGLLRLYLVPIFGEISLSKIRPDDIRSWNSSLAGSKPVVAQKSYRLMKTIMSSAVEKQLIGRNPCSIKNAGVEKPDERPTVEPTDIAELVEAIHPQLKLFVLLAAYGQLRGGELLGLKTTDVNLSDRSIRVSRQVLELRGKQDVGPPKTAAGVRTVKLHDALMADLLAHIDRFALPGGWLFPSAEETPRGRAFVYRQWALAKEKVDTRRATKGLPLLPAGLRVHDLRHSGLTLMASTGMTLKDLMARGGHSTSASALKYQHAADSRQREAADRLGDLLAFQSRDSRAMGKETPSVAASANMI